MTKPWFCRWLHTASLFSLLLLSAAARSQAQSPADSVDVLVRRAMHQLRIPGLQLAVVRRGQVLKLGNYGVANVQDSVPVTTQTRFFLNSITKAFVGVAAMQLVEAGQLDLAAICPNCRLLGTPSPCGSYLRIPPACPISCPRMRS